MRQIILDTETTGLEPEQGHRVIEIGCVELVDRRLTGNNFHQYLQPDREIDTGAVNVHGLTAAFLADKPRFGDIATDLIAYIRGAELIIHNAPFDTGFLDAELRRWAQEVGSESPRIADLCLVTDTLLMARKAHPGQRNSLDALCKRYSIDNSRRELHGALLDAEILADLYLAMTGGQASLSLESTPQAGEIRRTRGKARAIAAQRPPLCVPRATAEELAAHEARLTGLDKASGGNCLRSEERRVGKECRRLCRSRWSPYH
jgi:DNA polymerase-3 subunit epsilon